jgi:transportin-3
MIQICISIAALALQLTTWNSVIPDVVAACGTAGDSLDALLQFLAVLPEEAYDGRRIILTVRDVSVSGSLSGRRTQ